MEQTNPQAIEALTQLIEQAGDQVWRVSGFANGTGRTLWLTSGPLLMVPQSGDLFLQGPHADEVEPRLRAAGIFDHPWPKPKQAQAEAEAPLSRADRIKGILENAGQKVVHQADLEMGRVLMLACQVSVMVPEEGDLQYKGKDIETIKALLDEALKTQDAARAETSKTESDPKAQEAATTEAVQNNSTAHQDEGSQGNGDPEDERGPSGSVVQILEDHGIKVWRITPYASGTGRAIWLQSGPLVMVPAQGMIFVQGRGDLDHVTGILRETGLIN